MSTELVVPAQDVAVASTGKQDLISMIVSAARDPHVDAAKLRELWALKKEIDEQDAKNSFYRSMQAVQEEIRPVLRSSKGQNSRYARLEAIDKAIRPIYTKHGFSLTFGATTPGPGMLCITCDCMHRDGYQRHYELPGALDTGNKAKSDIQAVGSTVTYLRRYLSCLLFNVVLTDDQDDDDGSASGAISTTEAGRLWDLIAACEMDAKAQSAFCAFMGVKSVEEIRLHDFQRAFTALQSKLRKMQESR